MVGVAFDAVVEAARADAPWAYQRLFAAFGPIVAAYLRGQGADDPDGLANDVFLRVFTNLGRFEGDEDRFRSWVFTIAHHAVIDDRRRRSRRPKASDAPLEADEGPRAPAAELAALDRLNEEDVVALLDRLSPDQREVLLLRVVGDLTIEQVAATVGKRVGAVKQLQRRGLASLRRLLEEGGAAP